MKRAISSFLALAALAPAACSSSGATGGPTISYTEPTQTPPNDTQEAVLNPNAPPGNADQPPPNPDQAPFASSPTTTQAFDACPVLCGNIDPNCAARCAQTCAAYNVLIGTCGALVEVVRCASRNGVSCNDNGHLSLPQGACVNEIMAVGPCIERFNQTGTSTITPGPADTGNPPGPPILDGGR